MYVKVCYVVSGVYHVCNFGRQVVRLAKVYYPEYILMQEMTLLVVYAEDMYSCAFLQCVRMGMMD